MGALATAALTSFSLLAQTPSTTAQWTAISSKNAPPARNDETAVWTGTEVLVWGGRSGRVYHGNGAAYDPATDTWRNLTNEGAPSPRAWHSAVWTGRTMIVWGGDHESGEKGDGAAYDPKRDRWTAITSTKAPTPRGSHVAVWTGRRMFVWAGVDENNAFPSGALYDPLYGEWRPLRIDSEKPTPRTLRGVWTGKHVIAWGGINGSYVLGHGFVFDPRTLESRPMSLERAPKPRAHHPIVWTGSELVVWSGTGRFTIRGGPVYEDGARYDPERDRWRPLPTKNAPRARLGHSAVWNGREMIVAGGSSSSGEGLRDVHAWHPEQGWRRLEDLPEPRTFAHAFHTKFGTLLVGGVNKKGARRGGYLRKSKSAK